MVISKYGVRARALLLCALCMISGSIFSMQPGDTLIPGAPALTRRVSGASRVSDPFESDFEGSPKSGKGSRPASASEDASGGKSVHNNRITRELIDASLTQAHGGMLYALLTDESYVRRAPVAPEGNGYCRRIRPEIFFLEDVIKPFVRGLDPEHVVWFAAQSGASLGGGDALYTVESVLAFLADSERGRAFIEKLREFQREVGDDPVNLLRKGDEAVRIEAELEAQITDEEYVTNARARLAEAIERIEWLKSQLVSEGERVEDPRLVTPGGEPAAGAADDTESCEMPVSADEACRDAYSDALLRFFNLMRAAPGGTPAHK